MPRLVLPVALLFRMWLPLDDEANAMPQFGLEFAMLPETVLPLPPFTAMPLFVFEFAVLPVMTLLLEDAELMPLLNVLMTQFFTVTPFAAFRYTPYVLDTPVPVMLFPPQSSVEPPPAAVTVMQVLAYGPRLLPSV